MTEKYIKGMGIMFFNVFCCAGIGFEQSNKIKYSPNQGWFYATGGVVAKRLTFCFMCHGLYLRMEQNIFL